MNKELLFQSVKSFNVEKVETTTFLIQYFTLIGLNRFKASEEAEKRINTFIDFINNELIRCSKVGEVCIFQTSSNKNVTNFNLNFFYVQELCKELYSGIDTVEFEVACSKVLKNNLKIENANVTKAKGDGGYDFYGSYLAKGGSDNYTHSVIEIFGQSKQYAGNISRPEIEKFLGFIQKNNQNRHYKPTIYIFASTSDYSNEALQLANSFGIICWTGMQIASFIFNSLSLRIENPKEALLNYIKK